MTYVLLSIKPEWASAILLGNKRYEYRRVPPAINPPYTNLLYATDTIQSIVGQVHTPRVVSGPVDDVIEETIDETPHTPGDIREYFEGRDEAHAMECKYPTRYDVHETIDRETLSELGMEPSQNFRYVDKHPGEVASA